MADGQVLVLPVWNLGQIPSDFGAGASGCWVGRRFGTE
jgi:hypothetical protein